MIPLPAIGGIVAIAFGVCGFFFGAEFAGNRYKAAELTREREYQAALNAQLARVDQLAAELEVAKSETKVVFQTIEKEVAKVVVRDVYRSACIDDDGLRLANKALTRNGTRTGKPAAAVPPAPAP